MYYFVLSFTHKNIDISIREKLSINENEQDVFLTKCKQDKNIVEIFLLSTCNRVDFFVYTNDTRVCKIALTDILAKHCDIDTDTLNSLATSYKQDEAIYHTFCVASALDSLVIGETQIVGQLKTAFGYAYKNNYAGIALKNLINYALKCAAKIKNQTKLGSGSLSISSVAVKNGKKLVSKNGNVLVVGAGKMGMLAITHLNKNNFDISLCGRNINKTKQTLNEKAKKSKKKQYQNINIVAYEELNYVLNDYELVIFATNANEAIITKNMLKKHKNNIKRYWFDLALPRDVSDDIYNCDSDYNLKVYSVDDLSNDINENSLSKENSAKQALKIITIELQNFKIWLRNITLEPMLKNLYVKNEQITKDAISKASKKGHIKNYHNNSDDMDNLHKLINGINKKIFHNFSKHLRKNKISQGKIEFAQDLFK